jgi:hypothetical protein
MDLWSIGFILVKVNVLLTQSKTKEPISERNT